MNDHAQTAQAILARRELSRRRLLPFILQFEPNYLAGWVHKDICIRLEKFTQDVADGLSPRLILTMPPRHGKSLISSQYFPAWYLGQFPDHEIIATSYSGSLASKFSRSVRHIFREPVFHRIFPDSQLDPDAQSIENWYTLSGGSYTCAGVGGGITGRGAHVMVIDDPVKNAEDADSAGFRDGQWDWYTSTAYTRLAPGGGVLIIQTRWHHDDLSGRLIEMSEKGDGDVFEVINYPAIATHAETYRNEGEALHPERYPVAALDRIEKAVGPRVWRALYQQTPTEDTGSYFKAQWFRYYDDAPPLDTLQIYAAWDLAIGQREHNDFTVGCVVGIASDGKIFILQMIRGRWDAMDIVDQILNTAHVWKPTMTLLEQGHIEMAIGPYLEKRKMERGLSHVIIKSMATGRKDKAARARAIQASMEQGKLWFPTFTDWLEPLQREMLTFPYGKNDDQVDALAWIGLHLMELEEGRISNRPKPKSWKDKLSQYIAGGGGEKTPMSA